MGEINMGINVDQSLISFHPLQYSSMNSSNFFSAGFQRSIWQTFILVCSESMSFAKWRRTCAYTFHAISYLKNLDISVRTFSLYE